MDAEERLLLWLAARWRLMAPAHSRPSHCCRWPTLVMQISLVDEGRRVVPIVYYADGGGLYEGAAATAALP